jgi:hypothetical protein
MITTARIQKDLKDFYEESFQDKVASVNEKNNNFDLRKYKYQ